MVDKTYIEEHIEKRMCECGGELEIAEYPIVRCKLCKCEANINFFLTKEEYAKIMASELNEIAMTSKPDVVKLCKKCSFSSMLDFVVCPKCDASLEEMPVTEYLMNMSSADKKMPETTEEKIAFFLNLIELKKDMLAKIDRYDLGYEEIYYERDVAIELLGKIREDFISIFGVDFVETERGKKVVIK